MCRKQPTHFSGNVKVLYIYHKVFYMRPLSFKPFKICHQHRSIHKRNLQTITYSLSTVPMHALTVSLSPSYLDTSSATPSFLAADRTHLHDRNTYRGWTEGVQHRHPCTPTVKASQTLRTYASTQVKNENTLGENELQEVLVSLLLVFSTHYCHPLGSTYYLIKGGFMCMCMCLRQQAVSFMEEFS